MMLTRSLFFQGWATIEGKMSAGTEGLECTVSLELDKIGSGIASTTQRWRLIGSTETADDGSCIALCCVCGFLDIDGMGAVAGIL